MSEQQPTQRRNWLSFSLRWLLLFVALLAVASAGVNHFLQPYRQQQTALAALKGKYKTMATSCHLPDWLMTVLKAEDFQDVTSLDMEHCKLEDKDLILLQSFPRLQQLYLAGNSITDEGLVHVGKIRTLEKISLWNNRITAEGLKQLAHCSELRKVDAHDVHGSAALLDALAELKQLREFRMRIVFEPAELQALNQMHCPAAIAPHPSVRCLNVTDADLPALLKIGDSSEFELRFATLSVESWRQLVRKRQPSELILVHSPCPISDMIDWIDRGEWVCHKLSVDSNSCSFREFIEPHRGKIFSHASIYDSSFQMLSPVGVQHYQSFGFSGKVTTEDHECLSKSVQFRQMSIGASHFPDNFFRNQDSLLSVSYYGTVSPATLHAVSKLLHLEEFSCRSYSAEITTTDLEQLSGLSRLKILRLPDAKFPAGSFAFLAKLPNLESLELSGNQLGRDDLAAIGQLKKLTHLYINSVGPGLDNQAFACLEGCESLTDLVCRGHSFNDETLAIANKFPSLRRVSWNENSFSQLSLVEFRRQLLTRQIVRTPDY